MFALKWELKQRIILIVELFFLVTSDSSPYCVNETELSKEVKKQLKIDYINELED